MFGPSGSGKTTLLRALAGLEPEARGQVAVDGEVWQDDDAGRFVPAHRRSAGVVFQHPALFPHLDVRGNLRFGERRAPAGRRLLPSSEVAELLGLGPLLERRPAQLSGGEAQRVALGRALLCGPRILLLDEPLASADVGFKRGILPYLRRLRDRLGIPMVYVTHSMHEVLELADDLVLLGAGRVAARGTLGDILSRPQLPGAPLRPWEGSVVEATVIGDEGESGLTELAVGTHRLHVPLRPEAPGARLRLLLRAQDVSLSPAGAPALTSALNQIEATVAEVVDQAEDAASVALRLDAGWPLLARITRRSLQRLGLARGARVVAQIKSVALGGEGEG